MGEKFKGERNLFIEGDGVKNLRWIVFIVTKILKSTI